MIHVQRTFTVPLAREDAFQMVAQFGRAAEWDPALSESSQATPGAPGPGTSFDIVADFRGKPTPMQYVITDWQPHARLEITGTGAKARAVDTVTFADAPGGGTTITYAAALGLTGVLRLAEPFLRGTFNRMADGAVSGLATWLAGDTPQPAT